MVITVKKDNIIRINNGDNSINIINSMEENNPKYLVIVKKDGTILYACESFTKYYKLDASNKLSDFVSSIYSNAYEQIRKLILECLFTDKQITSEITSEYTNRTFKFIISPICLHEENEIILINVYDITKTKKIYEEIEELKNKLNESNSIKNVFLSNISHELKTPMNVIIGLSDILLETKETEKQKERFLKSINSNAKYLEELLNNIIDYSKIESHEFDILYENFSIKDLFDELIDLFYDVNFKKNLNFVKLNFFINEDRKIICDYLRLKQVLFNILSNSIKFTENGHINMDFKVIDNSVIFRIEDTGIGIPTDKIKHVFERFWQCDSSSTKKYKGTGLGLSVAKSIIELLYGEIWLESELNKGTTFYVKIPLEEIKQDILIESKDKINFSGKTILIVDELPVIYSILGIYLNSLSLNILSAYNGEEAIDIFTKQKEKIDLILLDLNLPDTDSLDIAKKLKKIDNNCKIISKSNIKDIENGFIDFHLKKPLEKQKILFILNEIFHK